MKRTIWIATMFAVLACDSAAKAVLPKVVERGQSVTLETQFKLATEVRTAYLTWQTYDDIKPKQSSMARAFGCTAAVGQSADGFSFACNVPLNVADGLYVLTSITIETDKSKREYSFTKDLPMDIHVRIEGGPEVFVPDIQSIRTK